MSARHYGPLFTNSCFVLIGPPASGKSTWRAENQTHAVVISGDDLIEAEAERRGLTYAEVFPSVDFKEQKVILRQHFTEAIRDGLDIIIDRTNLTVKTRRSYLASLPKSYQKVAVVFEVEPVVLFERLERRGRETGKTIPVAVVEDMISKYQPPMVGEFDQIFRV